MKKILFYCAFFVLVLSGCGGGAADYVTRNGVVITDIQLFTTSTCRYYITPTSYSFPEAGRASFIDMCGKFNVGDTVEIVKVTKPEQKP